MKNDHMSGRAASSSSPVQGGEASTLTVETVAERLDVNPEQGLRSEEAGVRQSRYGKNELAEEKKESMLKKFINQFMDFMILILIVAAIVSGFLGEYIDAVVIVAIVIVNAVLGVIQEGRAEKALAALQKMSAPEARAVRDGRVVVLPAADLVPGDVVQLEAGDVVPADIRLIESSNLKSNEAALTGESVPVEKHADFLAEAIPGIGDRENMVFSGTALTYGRASGIVVTTGAETEMGKIASRLKGIERESTPLQQNLNRLGKILGLVCLAICAVVFVVGLFQKGDPMSLFMTAVSLAVAAIPEGLPAVVTIVLALGMNRMARENAIVKRLLAVETLGSVDTICSDKTGTLTQNEMTVTRLYADGRVFDVSGTGYGPEGDIVPADDEPKTSSEAVLKRLFEIGVLCNDAVISQEGEEYQLIGDPTEGAMLAVAAKAGLAFDEMRARHTRRAEEPFDSSRKMMTVGHDTLGDGPVSLTKGAPDRVLDRCTSMLTREGIVPLTDEIKASVMAENTAFARSALRVLAFAYRCHEDHSYEGVEEQMVFVGLMGMIDPARPEARESIRVCHEAGIRVVMITGDHRDTAMAIADDLGLRDRHDRVLSGSDLDEMSKDELMKASEDTTVYARVSPENKVQIIEALKDSGHISSMTGDGVNDAPALKRADIGVAMGITGTEVAKGASDMILTDDNFSTIVKAVEEGRVIYSNIRKFVSFLLSCNVGEILVIFITSMIMGPNFAPLEPIQLLWLNLVTDSFPALALGQELPEKGIMKLPPRKPDAKILDREMMASIITQAVAIFVAIFAAFTIGRLLYPDVVAETGALVNGFSFIPLAGTVPSHGARTFAFITLIMAELLRAFSSRSERQSVFSQGVFTNRVLNRAFLVCLVLTLIVVYVPFLDAVFFTVSLTVRDWAIIIGLTLIPFAAGELFKKFFHRSDRVAFGRN